MIRKTNLAHRSNYGNKRSTSTIKYIVLHYTANDGDSDENNGKYFNGANRGASAHIFVDDDSCTQSVPDNYVAYSVGGNKYSNTKGGSLYGKATNANTLNIEMCDTVKNGKYEATAKTQENAITIVREKMKQYNIPIDRVIRHYDVTGKLCPAYFVDETAWAAFKAKITGTSTGGSTTPKPSTPTASGKINVVHQANAQGKGWQSEVTNYNNTNSNGYSGWMGKPIVAFRAKTKGDADEVGYLEYRAHRKGGGWYGWRRDYNKDNAGDTFAGDGKNPIDGLQFRLIGISGKNVRYRVHCIGKGWLAWVTNYGSGANGYAGWYGYSIDAVQIEVV